MKYLIGIIFGMFVMTAILIMYIYFGMKEAAHWDGSYKSKSEVINVSIR